MATNGDNLAKARAKKAAAKVAEQSQVEAAPVVENSEEAIVKDMIAEKFLIKEESPIVEEIILKEVEAPSVFGDRPDTGDYHIDALPGGKHELRVKGRLIMKSSFEKCQAKLKSILGL